MHGSFFLDRWMHAEAPSRLTPQRKALWNSASRSDFHFAVCAVDLPHATRLPWVNTGGLAGFLFYFECPNGQAGRRTFLEHPPPPPPGRCFNFHSGRGGGSPLDPLPPSPRPPPPLPPPL